ncbi:MAG: sensor histidine kinase [Acetivibrio sp.]
MRHTIKKITKKINSYITSLLRHVGIFKRLIVVFVVLSVLTSAFISLYSFDKYVKEIKTNIVKYLSLLVSNVVIGMDNSLNSYVDNAISFYDDDDILHALEVNNLMYQKGNKIDKQRHKENKQFIELRLNELQKGNKYIKSIQFVTPFEQYYMANKQGYNRGSSIKNLSEFYESIFYLDTKAANGYPVWFDSSEQANTFYKTESSLYGLANTFTLGIAVYNSKDRTFLGVLIYNIDRSVFNENLEEYSFYDDGNTYLVGTEGIIFGINPTLNAPILPADMIFKEQMFYGDSGTLERSVGDTNVFISYKQVLGTDFYVAHVVKESSLLKKAYSIRNECILLVLILVAISIIITYYTTNSISEPVRKLIYFMKKQQEGNLHEECPNSGNDEITYLVDKFNEMIYSMNNLIEKIYVAEIKEKEYEISNKNAQLDALQMQINPHFLYNTLDVIRWEAMYQANGENNVSDMIESFSRLLRMGLKLGGENITLESSIEHVALYLQVINFRHSNKIELHLDIQVDPVLFYIPPFTLQPILENAVVHAYNQKNVNKIIWINASVEAGILIISVEDNGDGMPEEKLNSLLIDLDDKQSSDRIGLCNVNKRLKLYYGEEYGLNIKSYLGKGTTVIVRLPADSYQKVNLKPYN